MTTNVPRTSVQQESSPAPYGSSGHRVDYRVGAPGEENVVSEERIGAGAKGARRASEAPAEKSRTKRRFSARRKAEAVLRLLGGENIETLSRELGVAAHELSRWRERCLASGQAALKQRPEDHRDEEIRRLKTKVGDLTMDNELLFERIHAMEAKHPFGGRRSKP